MNTISSFQLVDHGIDGCQYFPGCSSERFEHCVTGNGDTPAEAIEDALEQIAMNHDDIDTEAFELLLKEDQGFTEKGWPDKPSAAAEFREANDLSDEVDIDGCEMHYYISIRYNVEVLDEDRPEQGDYSISDCGPLGSQYYVGIVEGHSKGDLGVFNEWEACLQAIVDRMEAEQFWPNVWRVSDHGNISLVNLTEQMKDYPTLRPGK